MENNKKRFNRVRHFFLVLYCSVIELEKIFIKYSQRIAHAVYIVHDKDVYLSDLIDNDGNVKHRKGDKEKEHIHLLISFYNTHTFSAVKKLFTTKEDNPRVEPVNDMVKCFEYLTHINDKDKYQYSSEELIFAFDEEFYRDLIKEGEKRDVDNIAESIVKDILRGTNPMTMLKRYGNNYAIHFRQYKEIADEVLSWKVSHPTNKDVEVWDEELVQMGLLD